MRWRMIIAAVLAFVAAVAIAAWVLNAPLFGHWLQVHTGTINEPGPYYGFWSGFGSDLEEFGILGAVGAAIYQLVKKYNCHEPGCWRIGQHPAAGGQFLLCYRHHPDFQGKKPTHELIQRLHREHLERQAAIQGKLHEIHQDRQAKPTAAHDRSDSQQSAQRLRSLAQPADRCVSRRSGPDLAVRWPRCSVTGPAAFGAEEVRSQLFSKRPWCDMTAAGTADNVVGLVYISGFAPDEGDTPPPRAELRVAPVPMISRVAHLTPGSRTSR